MKGSLWAFRS